MEQLLKITTNNFQSIKFSQNAKLVPSDSVDIERRKAMARHMAFRARHSQNNGVDMDSINQINKTFHTKKTQSQTVATTDTAFESAFMKTMAETTTATHHTPASTSSAVTANTDSVSLAETAAYYLPENSGTSFTEIDYQQQSQASYSVERGAFEMRVAKGDISYVPALEMTIVTQYPSVEIEYVGDFNYLPPLDETDFSFVNLSI